MREYDNMKKKELIAKLDFDHYFFDLIDLEFNKDKNYFEFTLTYKNDDLLRNLAKVSYQSYLHLPEITIRFDNGLIDKSVNYITSQNNISSSIDLNKLYDCLNNNHDDNITKLLTSITNHSYQSLMTLSKYQIYDIVCQKLNEIIKDIHNQLILESTKLENQLTNEIVDKSF